MANTDRLCRCIGYEYQGHQEDCPVAGRAYQRRHPGIDPADDFPCITRLPDRTPEEEAADMGIHARCLCRACKQARAATAELAQAKAEIAREAKIADGAIADLHAKIIRERQSMDAALAAEKARADAAEIDSIKLTSMVREHRDYIRISNETATKLESALEEEKRAHAATRARLEEAERMLTHATSSCPGYGEDRCDGAGEVSQEPCRECIAIGKWKRATP